MSTKTWLPGNFLVKVDRASMGHGLEVRVPLLDYRLLEYCYNLPDKYKFNNEAKKLIIKDLLLKYLPEELIDRPKKGFSVPIANWLCGPLNKFVHHKLK